MKTKISLLFLALALVGVPSLTADARGKKSKGGKLYGTAFDTKNPMDVSKLSSTMGEKSELQNVVLKGTIAQVCQAEGCWVKLKNAAGEDVFVKFKDHAFLVPKDLAGRTALVSGRAVKKTVQVDERRHLAEDAGASAEEIAKITEPKEELRVEATGVVIM